MQRSEATVAKDIFTCNNYEEHKVKAKEGQITSSGVMLPKQNPNSAKYIDELTNSFQKGKCEEEIKISNYVPDFLRQ